LENDPDQHPDDRLVKGLFKKHAADILPYLVPGLRIIGPLEDDGIEILSVKEARTVSQGQYQIDPLVRENPTVVSIVAEAEAKAKVEGRIEGKIKGLQEAILELASESFPAQVVSQIQQTITSSQNIEQLKKFHRQIVRISDEQEVLALLAQCFPSDGEARSRSEYEYIQDLILDVVSDRFSSQVAAHVQKNIAPIQDAQLLRKFNRQLARASNEQEVYALLAECFPTH
jgi:hypothetical protein